MKTIFVLTATLLSLAVFSQDTEKVKQIDSLVALINNSGFKIQRDTIKQDRQDLGFSMQTYLTMLTNGKEIKKYVNNVHMTRMENGVSKQMIMENAFYYDQNKLIKVEEYGIKDDKKTEINWYYSNDKPVYNTSKTGDAQERADMLLTISKSMLGKVKL